MLREAQSRLEQKVDHLISDFQLFVTEVQRELLYLKIGDITNPTITPGVMAPTPMTTDTLTVNRDRRRTQRLDRPGKFKTLEFDAEKSFQ